MFINFDDQLLRLKNFLMQFISHNGISHSLLHMNDVLHAPDPIRVVFDSFNSFFVEFHDPVLILPAAHADPFTEVVTGP